MRGYSTFFGCRLAGVLGSKTLNTTRPVTNESEYETALREVSALIDRDPQPGTEAFTHLDALADLLVAYEKEHYPVTPPDPVSNDLILPVVSDIATPDERASVFSAALNDRELRMRLALALPPEDEDEEIAAAVAGDRDSDG